MAKQQELTIEEVLNKFSFEEIQAAQLAKQQRELQPRKDKVIADFEALKKEVLAIQELDETFPKPWKSSGKKVPSGKVLKDADLLTIQKLVKDEPQQLKDVAKALGVHHFTLKKYLKVYPAFKIATKNKKAILSYTAPTK
jgi:response regulator of citrate/malate metabolism